jgi:hypothetical protein
MRILQTADPNEALLSGYVFNAQAQDRHHRSYPQAEPYALGGPAAVMDTASDAHVIWNPAEDEWTGGFDIHLGVYTRD